MTVSQFNRNMKRLFDNDSRFKNVYVKGEVSGAYASDAGHFYFTLKDKSSVINCIVYRSFRKNIGFEIKDGMKLLVIANVVVYPPHGKYQLDVRSVTEDGLGKLFIKLQQLKEKLKSEGLFDKEHKKQLSRFPKTIGVITSKDGSVIHDIIKMVNQKWPYCKILLFPSAVQGPSATAELAKQIKRADSCNLDVLIVGRGGGSLEDVWSFNEEIVVRTIFNAKTPIISAVGHEDTVTLTDLVSDMSASTPTMAADFAIEDKNLVLKEVNQLNSRLLNFMSSKIKDYRKEFHFVLSKPLFQDSDYVYVSMKNSFEKLRSQFENASSGIVNDNKHMLENIKSEYVIRYPCKMQLDQSRSNLNELQTRLIDSMEGILKDNQLTLDKVANKFEFHSQNLLTSKKHELEMVEKYFSSNPCQNEIDGSRNLLKLSCEKVISNVNVRLGSDKKDFELLSSNFRSVSSELILRKSYELDSIKSSRVIKNPEKLYVSKKHELQNVESSILSNPYQNQIDSYRNSLNVANEKVISNVNVRLGSDKKDFELLSSNFRSVSSELILRKSYKLDSIKNSRVIKNPEKLIESQKQDFNNVKNEKIFRNPYLILDSCKSKLNIYKEKLDKISQVIDLKKQQEKQKSRYIKIIIGIIFLFIIFILLFGGI